MCTLDSSFFIVSAYEKFLITQRSHNYFDKAETIEQQRVCRAAELLSHKSYSLVPLYVYRTALSHTRGNAIKLSAKTIIYPDPAVLRNEGK